MIWWYLYLCCICTWISVERDDALCLHPAPREEGHGRGCRGKKLPHSFFTCTAQHLFRWLFLLTMRVVLFKCCQVSEYSLEISTPPIECPLKLHLRRLFIQ